MAQIKLQRESFTKMESLKTWDISNSSIKLIQLKYLSYWFFYQCNVDVHLFAFMWEAKMTITRGDIGRNTSWWEKVTMTTIIYLQQKDPLFLDCFFKEKCFILIWKEHGLTKAILQRVPGLYFTWALMYLSLCPEICSALL